LKDKTPGTPILEVLKPGILTSVQDCGRFGYQSLGIAESGAMDTWSLVAANRLLHNPSNAAGLEITLAGPKLRFLDSTWFSLTGADLSATLDEIALRPGACYQAREGQVLSFGLRRQGVRSYLGLPGGISVPPVLGSCSTYIYAGFGGFEGRALQKGDIIRQGEKSREPSPPHNLPSELSLAPDGPRTMRVIMGPHEDRFRDEGIQTFLSSVYRVTPASNRMGYRLEGPTIEHSQGPIVVSEATPLGAVQVPGQGQPVILLCERGTTGGYTKIACVISCDVDALAQVPDGGEINFEAVELSQAHDLESRRWQALDAWKNPTG
jgi:antagonist of KipI